MENAIIAHGSKRPYKRIAGPISAIRARPGMRTSASPWVSLFKSEFVARQTLLFSWHDDIRIGHRKYFHLSLERILTTHSCSGYDSNPIFTWRSECFIRNNLRIIICAILILPVGLRIQQRICRRSTRIRQIKEVTLKTLRRISNLKIGFWLWRHKHLYRININTTII